MCADKQVSVQVDLPRLTAAISIACRLGFATRLPNPAHDGASQPAQAQQLGFMTTCSSAWLRFKLSRPELLAARPAGLAWAHSTACASKYHLSVCS